MIYLVGNHDVGYGIDLTAERLDRFERAFGSVEEELEVAGHLLVKINNLNLDGATDQVWMVCRARHSYGGLHLIVTHIHTHTQHLNTRSDCPAVPLQPESIIHPTNGQKAP